MLPILLDMVDEIYASLDDQLQKNTFDIPLLFVPQRAQGECRQGQQPGMRFKRGGCPSGAWRRNGGCARQCPKGNCAEKPSTEEFQVSIDVNSFRPEEIEVKLKDREIIVEGKHEERQDELGFVSRQFSR